MKLTCRDVHLNLFLTSLMMDNNKKIWSNTKTYLYHFLALHDVHICLTKLTEMIKPFTPTTITTYLYLSV